MNYTSFIHYSSRSVLHTDTKQINDDDAAKITSRMKRNEKNKNENKKKRLNNMEKNGWIFFYRHRETHRTVEK